MIRYFVGMRRGPNNEALVVVTASQPPEDTDLVNVRRITAVDRDAAAKLYIEHYTGGKAAMLPKKN